MPKILVLHENDSLSSAQSVIDAITSVHFEAASWFDLFGDLTLFEINKYWPVVFEATNAFVILGSADLFQNPMLSIHMRHILDQKVGIYVCGEQDNRFPAWFTARTFVLRENNYNQLFEQLNHFTSPYLSMARPN